MSLLHWGFIEQNLAHKNMECVDPRLFSLRKLYNCTSESWCATERKQNGDKKKISEPTTAQEFDETTYLEILRYAKDSRLFDNVSFDREQVKVFARRFEKDMDDYCEKKMRE